MANERLYEDMASSDYVESIEPMLNEHDDEYYDSVKVLITGSNGVIGSALCKKMAKSGSKVVPYDIKAGFDIRDKGQLMSVMRDNDIAAVIHCAAVSRVSDCEKDPVRCKEVNIMGTKNIVECLRKQPGNPRMLFISSREVYGRTDKFFSITENAPYTPINEYGASKAEGEKIVARYPNSGIIRLTNVYGSAADYENRVIPAFVKAALTNKPLVVNGANNILDFIHIEDALNGIFLCLQKQLGETVHLTSGTGISLKQLAQRVVRLAGSQSRIIEEAAKQKEVTCFYGNPSKAKRILNWQTLVSLDYGIKKLIEELK